MSASRKKALRREENQTAMTERQQQERKESRKLRVYTILFVLLLVVLVVAVIATSVYNSGIIERNTTALTVNGEEVSVVELNYYYMDAINSYVSQYSDYLGYMGLNTSLPLNEQFFDGSLTWADYFLDVATQNARSSYAQYLEAQKNGYVLPDDVKSTIDSTINGFDNYAVTYGYEDAESFLEAQYGSGSDLDTYRHYMTVNYTAMSYYDHVEANLSYTDADLRAAESENYNTYSSFDYNYYYLPVSSFYEGGTTDANGDVTYSDEEIAAAAAAAKAAAEGLATAGTLEALDTAIAALEINADVEGAASIEMSNTIYTSIDELFRSWVADASRQANDISVFESSSTTTNEDGTEATVINGYYVVCYQGMSDNTFKLVNVRHILLEHEGGTTDSSGNVTYSDDEKATTMTKAENLLASYEASSKTANDFAALASVNSADGGSVSNGGLYESVYPGQMVENFNDWCFDPSRQPGDTGIVETEYGVHVMYFDSFADTTYRDYLITNDLRTSDMEAWYASVVDTATSAVKNTSYIKKDIYLNTES